MPNEMPGERVMTMPTTPVRHSPAFSLWLKPEVVTQIEFLEWTGANHLRHTKFIALRDDKEPRKVVKEA